MQEEWRDIPEFKGLYQASNLGRIRSLKTGIVMIPQINHKGYHRLLLMKAGKAYSRLIHRLVASAFIPNPMSLPQINHKDENKTNNNISNLEWCTNIYNHNYGTRNARVSVANSRPVLSINKHGYISLYPSALVASKLLGVNPASVTHACQSGIATLKGYKWRYADV